MPNIRDKVIIHESINDIPSLLKSIIRELDWLNVEVDDKEDHNTLLFKEKRRFDHFNRIEGSIHILEGYDHIELDIDLFNSGIGTVQEHYLKTKMNELLHLISDSLDRVVQTRSDQRSGSLPENMRTLSKLHELGELSDDEFRKAKERILDRDK